MTHPSAPASAAFLPDLAGEPVLVGGERDALALVEGERRISHGELGDLVLAEAARLGPERRVHVLTMRHDVESVVRLLGALTAGHPVALVGPQERQSAAITAEYDGVRDVHPDLALLLSTSGSTGSPKLVRLTAAGLAANAESIAAYLGLTTADRAVTVLPLHYCYGLSVLTSHLAAGASVVLSDLSVADACFWDLVRRERVTGIAGVPYTFELLDSTGFAERDLPDLRYLTQAGGRMAPQTVRRHAELGARRGHDLVVMYGQTEATARMAYLPPHLAAERPTAIGVPIPGGDFRLDPVEGAEDGVGELVYTGPNVMMGYAECAADLARGPELSELRTGDLARQADDGLWEIVGRRDRLVKLYGLRLDLARLEAAVPQRTALVATDEALHAFVVDDDPAPVAQHLRQTTGLPPRAVRAHRLAELPTTERGKTDGAALRRRALDDESGDVGHAAQEGDPGARGSVEDLVALYARLLDRPDAGPDDSFVDLGGDSLSFVEMSVQLGRRLHEVPPGWQYLTPRRLAAAAPRRRSRWTTPVEPSVLLRAVAIVLIVVSHVDLWVVMGSAHVLLAVAGFNVARFVLPTPGRGARVRRLGRTIGAVALPAGLWILLAGAVAGDYRPATALFLNQATGPAAWSPDWQFWFLEVLVWSLAGLAALLAVPRLDRWHRTAPFAVACTALVLTLGWRYASVGVAADGIGEYTLPAAAWCLAAGWAAAEARGHQRWVVLAIALAGTVGFFPDQPERQLVLAAGLVLLVQPRSLPVPRMIVPAVQVLASASLWIYLTHWQVYPELEAAGRPLTAIGASLAVGVAAWWTWRRLTGRVRRLRHRA